jgi:uracil-DNA glycosylase family 4
MIEKLIHFLEQEVELYGNDFPLDLDINTLISEQELPPTIVNEIATKPVNTIKDFPKFNILAVNNSQKLENNNKIVKEKITHFSGNNLNDFFTEIKDCQNCFLGSCRKKFVFGKGQENAEIMIIGEAPGEEEDKQGEPFVGPAGQLLDKILQAVDIQKDLIYVTNIVKCRPPNNRDPLLEEINDCLPYLNKQIELIKPKLILVLGRVAGQILTGNMQATLSSLRGGKIHSYKGIDMFVTYHPSALLRHEEWKRPTWEDMKALKKHYLEISSQP